MNYKLTPWFPGSIKPVRCGVYQQKDGLGKFLGYQYWDGEYWYSWCASVEAALRVYHFGLRACSSDPWRGVMKEKK